MYFESRKSGGKFNDVKLELSKSDSKGSSTRLKKYSEEFRKLKGEKTRGGNN